MDNTDIVAIDIETTGLSRESNEITEVGLVRVTHDLQHEIARASMRFRIERPEQADQRALEVFGWTEAGWANAVPRKTHLGLMHAFCVGARPLGHNAIAFDLPFLAKAFEECGLSSPWAGEPIDTMLLVRSSRKHLFAGATLNIACRVFGIERPKIHRALDDALACLEVARRLRDV